MRLNYWNAETFLQCADGIFIGVHQFGIYV